MRLTETFNKATVSEGEIFQIELEGMPTAGYLWQAEVVSGKAELLGNKTVPVGNNVGGGAVQRFTFRAEETGEIEICANYGRPWEKTAEKSQTFKITVK